MALAIRAPDHRFPRVGIAVALDPTYDPARRPSIRDHDRRDCGVPIPGEPDGDLAAAHSVITALGGSPQLQTDPGSFQRSRA